MCRARLTFCQAVICFDFTAGGKSLLARLHCFIALQMADEISGDRRQIPPPDHEIDQPGLEQRIGAVRILWRRDACGLLDDSRPDESDLRARLGNQDVAERGEAGRHAAKCRVRQNGNEGKFADGRARKRRPQLWPFASARTCLPARGRRRWPPR